MTERNEFGFEEWQSSADSFEEVPEWKSRAIWHAAIDAIRSKLAAKELWIAPMEPDDEMEKDGAYAGTLVNEVGCAAGDAYRAMRDSYIAEYGQAWESGLD